MMNRREALARIGGFMAAGWITSKAGAQTTATIAEKTAPGAAAGSGVKGQSFSVAHITDIHVYDERHAPTWFGKGLHHIQSNAAKPSFIINTGDCVMDSLKQEEERTDELWRIWNSTLKNENSLPIHHCLGNHDHWGLGLKPSSPARNDVLYGKKRGIEALGLERPYYSFDHGDWHFIAMDSVFPTGRRDHSGWIAKLDDEQFEWLERDLAATPADRHVALYTHVPVIQVTSLISQEPDGEEGYKLGPWGMLNDARRVIDLFAKHPNVKLCMSGHMHLEDRIELSGVTYICDGALCGGWWKGDHRNCHPGYSIFTFNPDGSFEHDYQTYGWKLLHDEAKG